MTERTRWWAESLAHWSLGWSVVVLLVAAWLLLRRPRRVAVRYAGWLLATFAGAALLPLVIGLVPRFSWPDAFAGRTAEAKPAARPEPFRSWFEGRAVVPATTRSTSPDRLRPAEPVREDRRTVPASAGPVVEARPAGDRWLVAALAVWMAGASIFLARLAWAAVRVRTLIAAATPVAAGGLAEEVDNVRGSLAVRRRVRIMVHPDIATPMCVGLARPVILWPTEGNCPMNALQRRAGLVHEVAHLRHLDDWVALVAEIWRGLTWFFLPVHWTLARLRQEREYRCDDLAAGELHDPERYARWLLDLAPVRIASPLSASLSSGSGLAERVRRILRGESTSTRPLGRRQIVVLAILGTLLLGAAGSVRLVGLVHAEEAADAPLPEITARELATRIRAAWPAYDKGYLELAFETTTDTNWRSDQEPIMVRFPGKVRYLGDGVRWRVEYDSMMPSARTRKLTPHRWSSGFDGRQRYGWDVVQNVVTFGETEGDAEFRTPRNQFWHEGKSFTERLEKPVPEGSTITIRQRTVDGVRCYVVERDSPKYESRTEEIVSPRQGYLLLRTTWFLRGMPYHIHALHDVREVAPGVWAPGRVVEESRNIRKDGTNLLSRRTESRVVAFDPHKTFTAGTFSIVPPYGADVTDRRLGYSYHNDPWWPEAGKLLRERFDWPKADLSTLKTLGSPEKFKDKTAPPISATAWINSPPLALDQLKGKVVLLEFWGTWSPPCREKIPAMRTLYETYHPLGLEVISIHTPTDDVEAVHRFVDDYRMPYPIAVDAGGEDGGVTSQAYQVSGYPSALVIDHLGQVHPIGDATPDGKPLVDTLVEALRKAGGKDVPAIVLDHSRLSDAMYKAVADALPQWVATAPKDGAIRGRLLDGQDQPVAGANVTAVLELSLLSFAFPGGYTVTSNRRRFAAVSGADGRFELTGLTKGMYEVKVDATGRARHERLVAVGPDLRPAEADFSLAQGDTISGRVLDPAGRPIAGATIDPTKWHHDVPSNVAIFTQPSGASSVQSDAEGHYRLPSLRSGGYTLEVTAPGFKPAVLEAVPSGTQGADATLVRPEASTPGKPS